MLRLNYLIQISLRDHVGNGQDDGPFIGFYGGGNHFFVNLTPCFYVLYKYYTSYHTIMKLKNSVRSETRAI